MLHCIILVLYCSCAVFYWVMFYCIRLRTVFIVSLYYKVNVIVVWYIEYRFVFVENVYKCVPSAQVDAGKPLVQG